MNRRVTSVPLIVVGSIVVIIGGVFAGQGANVIHGSAMSGETVWLDIGLIMVVVGIVVIVIGVRRPRRNSSDS